MSYQGFGHLFWEKRERERERERHDLYDVLGKGNKSNGFVLCGTMSTEVALCLASFVYFYYTYFSRN
jgi:hypothetical protein